MRLRIANKTPQSKAILTLLQNDNWKKRIKIGLNAHFRPQLNFDLSHRALVWHSTGRDWDDPQLCWSMTLHMCDIELRVSKRIHNYTQPNLLNRTHVWHWTGRDTLDPGGEIGHLSPGLWAQHVPPRQLEFKRSEPNVTFQILYFLTLVTLTNYAVCLLSAVLCSRV